MSASDAKVGGWCNPASFVLAETTLLVSSLLICPHLDSHQYLTIESHAVFVNLLARSFTPRPYCGVILYCHGDLVTLNSAAILPRNSQWFSQTKLRASLYLTTLQELSLAKAQVGGSLPIRKILPRVPKNNNKWLLLLVRLSTYLIYLRLLCT